MWRNQVGGEGETSGRTVPLSLQTVDGGSRFGTLMIFRMAVIPGGGSR
jgi:hypothetical protein